MAPIGGTCRKIRDRSEATIPSGSLARPPPVDAAPDGAGPADDEAAALAAEGAADVATEADGFRVPPVASRFPALIAAMKTTVLASTRRAGTTMARLRRSSGRAARSSRTWAGSYAPRRAAMKPNRSGGWPRGADPRRPAGASLRAVAG